MAGAKDSAGNEHGQLVPGGGRGACTGAAGQKLGEQVPWWPSRVSRRRRLTMVRGAENQEIPRKGR